MLGDAYPVGTSERTGDAKVLLPRGAVAAEATLSIVTLFSVVRPSVRVPAAAIEGGGAFRKRVTTFIRHVLPPLVALLLTSAVPIFVIGLAAGEDILTGDEIAGDEGFSLSSTCAARLFGAAGCVFAIAVAVAVVRPFVIPALDGLTVVCCVALGAVLVVSGVESDALYGDLSAEKLLPSPSPTFVISSTAPFSAAASSSLSITGASGTATWVVKVAFLFVLATASFLRLAAILYLLVSGLPRFHRRSAQQYSLTQSGDAAEVLAYSQEVMDGAEGGKGGGEQGAHVLVCKGGGEAEPEDEAETHATGANVSGRLSDHAIRRQHRGAGTQHVSAAEGISVEFSDAESDCSNESEEHSTTAVLPIDERPADRADSVAGSPGEVFLAALPAMPVVSICASGTAMMLQS